MTRKDYVLIANTFSKVPDDLIKQMIITALCVALHEDNNNFNDKKFAEACKFKM